ncbi:MAG: hypothetical protein IJ941_00740, partial [Clostridia bacterium]|nr:hypothetical protein [Clostridia bacterium]
YDSWAVYTYCEFAGQSWPYVREQAGVSNSAYSNPRYGHPTDKNGNEVVDDNHVHNDGEDHQIECIFNQVYGGGQGVYGPVTHKNNDGTEELAIFYLYDGAELPADNDLLTIDNPPSAPAPEPSKKSGSGISVTYNGGNSFSTSNSAVPTGVEIDNVPVSFTGNGNNFTVSGIPAGAKWITVRWNSTSVTTNFTPNGAYFAEVEIPKTGDMPFWAAIAAFFGF